MEHVCPAKALISNPWLEDDIERQRQARIYTRTKNLVAQYHLQGRFFPTVVEHIAGKVTDREHLQTATPERRQFVHAGVICKNAGCTFDPYCADCCRHGCRV